MNFFFTKFQIQNKIISAKIVKKSYLTKRNK